MLKDHLKAPSRFAFMAGRELGWRAKWMITARNEPNLILRGTYVRFARACNHEYLRSLRLAIECQPRFFN